MARPRTFNEWIHTTIYCKSAVIDKIKKLAAPTGKEPSRYLIDTLLSFDGKPPDVPKDVHTPAQIFPLCVKKDEWQRVKERAKIHGMTLSNYIRCVISIQ